MLVDPTLEERRNKARKQINKPEEAGYQQDWIMGQGCGEVIEDGDFVNIAEGPPQVHLRP